MMMPTNARIAAGETVAWTSQSAGVEKRKEGRVLAFVPHFSSAALRVPVLDEVPRARLKFDADSSAADRYIVEVPRANGKGADYYAPMAGVLEKQNAKARREER